MLHLLYMHCIEIVLSSRVHTSAKVDLDLN